MALNIVVHRKNLVDILKDIYSSQEIASFLGFKGGTAAYLFYGLDRFSVDLDFDLLDAGKEEYIFNRVKEIIGKYGVVKEARIKRFNLLFILSYDNKERDAQNVKIEINRREFNSHYDILPYLGISMKVMVKEDMVANKLLAMKERLGRSNRDIYDGWFFLKNMWFANKEIVEKRSGMNLVSFLEESAAALEKFSDKEILAGLGELLDEKQKAWVKSDLRKETIFLLRNYAAAIKS